MSETAELSSVNVGVMAGRCHPLKNLLTLWEIAIFYVSITSILLGVYLKHRVKPFCFVFLIRPQAVHLRTVYCFELQPPLKAVFTRPIFLNESYS